MHFISGIGSLLCARCGCVEDVLVLRSRRQGCEVEECQQTVVGAGRCPPAVTVLLGLKGKRWLLLGTVGQSHRTARLFPRS